MPFEPQGGAITRCSYAMTDCWSAIWRLPDFDAALAAMAGTDVNRRWQTEMAHFFEGIPGKKADEQMMRLRKSSISIDRQRLERYPSLPLLSAKCSAGRPSGSSSPRAGWQAAFRSYTSRAGPDVNRPLPRPVMTVGRLS